MSQDKDKIQLYYATGESIQRGDIVLYLSCNDEYYDFNHPIMKVWDIITTNAGELVGVALIHPSVDNPAVSIRVIQTRSEQQQNEEARTFGEIPSGYITTDTLVSTLDIEKLLCLLFKSEQISKDQEQNRRLINESIERRVNQNNGVALFFYAKNAKAQRDFDKHILWLEKALRVNYTPAMCELALNLVIGSSIEKNEKRSFSVYQHASALGDAVATYALAGNYASGTVIKSDLDKSIQLLELAVKQGSWKAILSLGSYYRFGWLSAFLGPRHQGYREINSKIINFEKAFFNFAYIIEQAPKTEITALMNAQYHLAWMYQDGIGVKQDYEQAVYWYQQAADLGNIVAVNNLADKYENGLGVAQDLDKAFELYSMAAGQVIAADLSLGRMYLQGRGVEKNLELAKKHLTVVLNSGASVEYQTHEMLKEAWELLESFAEDTVLKRTKKILEAPEKFSLKEINELAFKIQEDLIPNAKEFRFKLFLECAKKGDIDAQSQIGDWYLRGIGTTVNTDEAFKWIYKAHKQDNWYAHYQMGYLYENGIVVPQDLEKAQEFYQASLQEITMFPKYINGQLNPEYQTHYHLCNKESLDGIERVKILRFSKRPKWMFWKK